MRTASPKRNEACALDGGMDPSIEEECAARVFKDVRLKRRFVVLLGTSARTIGGNIPFVCQDWAKA